MVINISVQDVNYAMKPALQDTAWGPLDKPDIMSFSSLNENGKVNVLNIYNGFLWGLWLSFSFARKFLYATNSYLLSKNLQRLFST